MASLPVVTPRLNANEDQVLVTDVIVAVGTRVAEGALLVVVESTKSATEVLAPAAGVVTSIAVSKGAMVDVGAALCTLEVEQSVAGAVEVVATAAPSGDTKARPTAKAQLRARELGIDIAGVVGSGDRVTVEDVERHAAKGGAPARKGRPATHAKPAPGTRAVMVGGGELAVMLIDALRDSGYDIVGATDPKLAAGTPVLGDVTVLGDDAILPRLLAEGVSCAFIALMTGRRAALYDQVKKLGFSLPSFVHPGVWIGAETTIGDASYVLQNALLGPRVSIGDDVIVNNGAIVSHDCVIGDHAHLAPGSVLAGTVTVGEGTTIGMAATVYLGKRVGAGCLVHNNAAVVGDIGDRIEYTRQGKHVPRG